MNAKAYALISRSLGRSVPAVRRKIERIKIKDPTALGRATGNSGN